MYECIVGEVLCPGSQVWRYGQSLHDILYFIGADDGKTADMEFDPINLARERAASIIIDAMKRSTERLSGPDSE